MRRQLLLTAHALFALLPLPACNRFSGPIETRQMGRVDPYVLGSNGDRLPIYSIDEQKMRGRERLTISEDDFRIGPKGYIDRTSPLGR